MLKRLSAYLSNIYNDLTKHMTTPDTVGPDDTGSDTLGSYAINPIQVDLKNGFSFTHDKPWIDFTFSYMNTSFHGHIPIGDPEDPLYRSDSPMLFLDAHIGAHPYRSENEYGHDLLRQIVRECQDIENLEVHISKDRDIYLIARVDIYAPVNMIHIISALSEFILRLHPVLELMKLSASPIADE